MARKLCQMTEPQNLPYSRRYHREEAARQADSIRREDSQPTGTAKRSCKWPPETANFMSKPNAWPTRTPYLRAAGNN
jgi:hypothetical protein